MRIFWAKINQITYFKTYILLIFIKNPNFVFIFVENASFKYRPKSDKDLVTIWDPLAKSDTGFGMPICELTRIDYQIMSGVF
jgi:hypothetical protein